MIELSSVLNCERVMMFNNVAIHYTTGVCNEVYLAVESCIKIFNNFGDYRTRNIYSTYQLMDSLYEAGVVSRAIMLSFQEHKIAYEMENRGISIDVMIKATEYFKMNNVSKFLKEAKSQINELGLYVGNIKYENHDKRKCADMNLANTLDVNAIDSYATLNNMFVEDVYVEICDIVANLVFGRDMSDVRLDHGLYYEEYLSDYITQSQYDEVSFLCSVLSYMMKYSDISFKGMKIFCHIALLSVIKRTTVVNAVETHTDIDDDPYLQPLKKEQERIDEVEDFKRYM